MSEENNKPVKQELGEVALRNKERYIKQIVKIIEEKKLFNIYDIFAFYQGCSKSTFYNMELEKLDIIKDALEKNRSVMKQTLRYKWANSENATLQISLFKLLATEEERMALSINYQDVRSGDGSMSQKPVIVVNNPDTKIEIEKLINNSLRDEDEKSD